jgi:hypothetical protein
MAKAPIRDYVFAEVNKFLYLWPMKFTLFFFIMYSLSITPAFCQEDKDVNAVDTISLPELKFKKTIAFITPSVTIMVDYDNYMSTFNPWWKMYKKGRRGVERERKKGEYINPTYVPRYNLIDSMHTLLVTQVKERDTIYIEEFTFGRMGVGPGHDFSVDIDAKKCVILNKAGEPQRKIIRKRYAYQTDLLIGRGGRRYYFINSKSPFIAGTDWVS